jgi:hypothetical protein
MWALRNRTPYGAERNWTRDKTGVHHWLVAVRATFGIAPSGKLTLADEQPPPALEPEYLGEPFRSSLRCDSDLLAVKPLTDVLVIAHAHAERGRPTATVHASFRFDQLEKTLVVHGERVYYEAGLGTSITQPRPFVTRPIRYELAFGGSDLSDPDPHRHRIDERNPIGRGVVGRGASLAEMPAHTIEYPHGNPAERGPAGFGALEAAWLPRRTLAGTYDAQWAQTKRPLLPDDYHPTFAMSAPRDQWLDRPAVGGELMELRNMTEQGVLQFEIPRISLRFVTRFGSRRKEHAAQLATVLAEPEERRLTLVFQTSLRVHARDADYLDDTEITELRSGT